MLRLSLLLATPLLLALAAGCGAPDEPDTSEATLALKSVDDEGDPPSEPAPSEPPPDEPDPGSDPQPVPWQPPSGEPDPNPSPEPSPPPKPGR